MYEFKKKKGSATRIYFKASGLQELPDNVNGFLPGIIEVVIDDRVAE